MKLYTFDPRTLKYKHFFIIGRFAKMIFIILLLLLFLGISKSPIKTKYITDIEKIILIEEQDLFNEETLIEEIDKLNFKFPYIVLAQSILETANYESKIFKENNNLFGMKEARVRLNLAEGTQYGHAYYKSWKESLTDYALWYSTYAYKCKNEKQLYKLLNKQYAEANHYPQALQEIIKNQNLKQHFKKN
tara:strand:+ start:42 stop:611 length:570 start_codon:yes stop_codon:yes gene_type:complete